MLWTVSVIVATEKFQPAPKWPSNQKTDFDHNVKQPQNPSQYLCSHEMIIVYPTFKMMFLSSNHVRGEPRSLSGLQESRAERLRIHCYWFRHLLHAQTICCSLTFDMQSPACGKGPYSLSHKRWEVTSSFPHPNALTEEDKTRHQFNRNALVLCHDIISCHLSPLVIPRPPRRATTASGDNSRGYGSTGGSPCSAASRERWARPGRSVAFMREPGLRALLFLECRRGLAGATVQWNGKHAIPCSAWCRVTVRGCVMFLGYWLNDLGLHDKSLNPCGLSACWQRNVSSTCLHIDPRTLPDWRVRVPKVSPPGPRNNLSTTSPVFHALLAAGLPAIETFHRNRVSSTDIAMDYLSVAVNLFGFRYMDDMT